MISIIIRIGGFSLEVTLLSTNAEIIASCNAIISSKFLKKDREGQRKDILYDITLVELSISLDSKNVNIFLPISFNICFGCSKEPSH